MHAMEWIIGLLVVWGLLFVGVPLWVWTLLTACMVGLSYFNLYFSPFFAVPVFLIFLFFFFVPLRRQLLTRNFVAPFRKVLPPISPTEQAALDAGDIWWEGDLFRGMPSWDKLFKLPIKKLTDEEQSFLDNQVNKLCEMVDNWAITQGDWDLPQPIWDYIKKERFLSMIIPKQYGGLGFSAIAHSTVVSRIATRSPAAAVTVMVPNSLGPGELLLHYGTEEQKNHYLPRLADGREIPCFALTGPEAGSDAGAIPDKGIVCRGQFEGKEVIGISLTWDKRYITLAPVATVLGIAFKLYDPENLLGKGENLGITLCLLPTSHPGVETGSRYIPINTPFMNGPTRGKDVFVPLDWVIGGVEKVGQGWRMLMECLAAGRGISLPALGNAVAAHCYKTTSAYALVRKQFNTSIGYFEGIQEKLGAMGGLRYLLESMRTFTVSAIDQGFNPAVATAISKYHMTEYGRVIINDALDIHGGKGIIEGPKNYLAAGYYSVPVAITVEGANILTRNLMIFGQGAVRCHPYVVREIQAANSSDTKQGLIDFDKALMAHVGYSLSNFVRTLTLSLTKGWYCPQQLSAHPVMAPFQRQFSRYSCALAFVSDIAMLMLGGDLKRRENLSARLGDVLSYLYMASAAMHYFKRHGELEEDQVYIEWCLSHCLYEIEKAFIGFFANFPNRLVAMILRNVVLPFGASALPPADKCQHRIVRSMLTQTEIRKRLTAVCPNIHNSDDPVVRLETAFNKMLEVEPILTKIQQTIRNKQVPKHLDKEALWKACADLGVISQENLEALRVFETLRLDVINVDEFPKEFFKK